MRAQSDRPIVHGVSGYSYRRCRCDICRTATVDYQRDLKRRKGHIPIAERPIVHGRNAYSHGTCRCDVCRAANAEYQRQYNRRKGCIPRAVRPRTVRLRVVRPLVHGASAYAQGKCRCETCRASRREYMRDFRKSWRKRDHARVLAVERARCAANPEAQRASKRKYYSTPRGRLAITKFHQVRRARKLGAPGYATAAQIKARINYYGGRCWVCGKKADSIDHVKPLSKGGSNWPANLRPACRSCNSKRGNRGVAA